MIGTEFIHQTYVWTVKRPFACSTTWVCQNASTGHEKWFYAEEIEEHAIKQQVATKPVKPRPKPQKPA